MPKTKEIRLTIPSTYNNPIPTYYYKLKSSPPPDLLTWRQHLTTSLNALLGLQGTTITIDILKHSAQTGECIIRASGVDADKLGTAVAGGYTGGKEGVRVLRGVEAWAVGLVGEGEADLWGEALVVGRGRGE